MKLIYRSLFEYFDQALPTPASSSKPADDADADDEDDDDERIPDLTPTLFEFTKIRLGDFEKSYKFIQDHSREVMLPGVYNQLVIAGFRAAVKKDFPYARQCVHQGMIVQYCEKLGRDGPGLFFKRFVIDHFALDVILYL